MELRALLLVLASLHGVAGLGNQNSGGYGQGYCTTGNV